MLTSLCEACPPHRRHCDLVEYARFQAIKAVCGDFHGMSFTPPSKAVDSIWHAHILADLNEYVAWCQKWAGHCVNHRHEDDHALLRIMKKNYSDAYQQAYGCDPLLEGAVSNTPRGEVDVGAKRARISSVDDPAPAINSHITHPFSSSGAKLRIATPVPAGIAGDGHAEEPTHLAPDGTEADEEGTLTDDDDGDSFSCCA